MRDALIRYRGDRSQEEMASIYGVSQQTWSCWENGKATPTAKLMSKISKDAGLPVEVLFLDIFN